MKTPRIIAITIVFLLSCNCFAQEIEFNYIKKSTRKETRSATMAQYSPSIDWKPWYIIGPFDNPDRGGHDIVYAPELNIDLAGTYKGRNGELVSWKSAKFTGWDPINLKQFGNEDLHYEGTAYLYREFHSENKSNIDCNFGSDDGLKLWLNGKLVIDADAYRGMNLADHLITLNIKPGRNTLLAKVTQGVGGWDFQMRPITDHRIEALLEYRLNLDFPTSPEAEHYRVLSIIEPENVVLEVGGIDILDDGRPIIATRRGEVWIIEGAYDDPPFDAKFKLFASGLHEPLGATVKDGALLAVQRSELTRMIDTDGDDEADVFETISDPWGLSGNYHEFAFGPKYDGQGRAWITLNLGFSGPVGSSDAPWRGWAMIVNQDGSLTPVCGGLRSPCGIGRNAAGDMFYTDNQGDWVGTCKLSHLDFGDWHGHPAGNRWYQEAGFDEPNVDTDFKQPAVWFPYGRMGQSISDVVLDDTGGKFGPFENQIFIGDQTNALVMRVFLEKIDGVYQGACFPFRSGLDCGVTRMCFGNDGSMFVGMTNRGWGSVGRRPWGVQRIVYTGVLPFEVKEMRVKPDGFELTFTEPIDPVSAGSLASYEMESFTYLRHKTYGSDEINRKILTIQSAAVSDDGYSVHLTVDGMRLNYVHELKLSGVRNAKGKSLLHDKAYYTLNVIPTE
ncbi:MAG: hypothetical protein IH984_07590 [Planctomycetes bacterium]|nr:hypothetical protein [Planctomycetota bacterium]